MPEALRKKRSEYMKAHPLSYWKGKKRGPLSKELKKKLSESQKLAYKEGRRKVSITSINNLTSLNKGKYGEEHPKWTLEKKRPFYGAIRMLHKYKTWRSNIFKRDDFTCQMCLTRGGYLEADHNPKRFIDIVREQNLLTIEDAIMCEELWNAKGRTLCKKCHLTTYRLSKR